MRRINLISLLALVLGAFFVLLSTDLISTAAKDWLGYVGWFGFSLAAGLRSLVSSKRAEQRHGRLAWALFGIAALAWCAGNLYLIVGELTNPDFVASPTLANYLFLGYVLLFIPGLYFLRSDHSGASYDAVRLADIGTIGCAVLLCAAIIMVEPLLHNNASLEFVLFAIADPAAFVVASLVALTYLWTQDLGELRTVLLLLFCSIVIHTLANLAFFALALKFGSVPHSLTTVWMVVFSIQYLAAIHYDGRPSKGTKQPSISQTKVAVTMQAMLPAVLIFSMLTVVVLFRENLNHTVLLAGIFLITLFAVMLGIREWAINRRATGLIEELRRADDLNSHVLSASPAIIFTAEVADNFPITFVSDNFRGLIGVEPGSFLQLKNIHPNDRALMRTQLSNILRYGFADAEFRLASDSEDHRWLAGKFVLAHNADGKPTEIVGSLIDISEKKVLQSRIQQTQRLESLGKLSGSIAHDFNNLLTAVLGYSELTLASDDLPEKHRNSIMQIKAAGERGAALTRQLLTFSGRHAVNKQTVDLRKVINGMTGMLDRLIGDSVSMSIRLCPAKIQVNADTGQIEQVLMNLVLNARDAMQDGGLVTVGLEEILVDQKIATDLSLPAGPYAVISVKDNGPGVDEELLDRVFEPFFSTKAEQGGTGLGLSIVHSIVEQHGGTVTVDSKLGNGCNFKVYLPSIEGEPAMVEEKKGLLEELPCGAETVLVVDDEPAITNVIARTLQPLGYLVLTANNAKDALSIAQEQNIDLLLSDVIMPDGNGDELRKQIQLLHPRIKWAYMSGYTDRSMKMQELAADGTPFLAKPLSLSGLAMAIRDLLDSDCDVHSKQFKKKSHIPAL